jgi:tetratricopeptide (TPR) repeat protein
MVRRAGIAGVVLVVLVIGVLALTPAAPSGAAPDCERAKELAAAGLLDDAVAVFEAAKKADLPCGSDKPATDALAAQKQADRLVIDAQEAEGLGKRAEALTLYSQALAINRQQGDAVAAVQRLAGVTAPSTTTTTADPFAGPKQLEKLGRDSDARAAAIEAIKESGKAPTGKVKDLVDVSPWEHTTKWISDHWKWIALVIVVLLAWGWSWIARSAWYRRIRKVRLIIAVKDQSGLDPSLADAFATRLQDQLARQQDGSPDERAIVVLDTKVDLPDLSQAPSQAKWLFDVWGWVVRNSRITLQVALLPAAPEGASCRVALLESNGTAIKATKRLSRVISRRPGSKDWTYPPPAAGPSPYFWQELVPVVAAWGLFAVETIRTKPEALAGRFGTNDQEAYARFLDGVEAMNADPARAVADFSAAIEAAGGRYDEASLNMGYSLSLMQRYDKANTILHAVATKIAEDASSPRIYGLRFRVQYNLAVIAANQATSTLVPETGRKPTMKAAVDRYRAEADALDALITEIAATPVLASSPVAAAAASTRVHADLLRAGAMDLDEKLDRFTGSDPHMPGLPAPDALEPNDEGYPSPELCQLLNRYRTAPRSSTASYSLACIWARDARVRAGNHADSKRVAARFLADAIDDDLTGDYGAHWREDPDFKPLADDLAAFMAEAEAG